jgi:predicted MPP superfamily phosphohydrolase
MSEITILHLSDVHCKQKEKETDPTFSGVVKERMIHTIKEHMDINAAVPDVVVVTGDVAFSGKEYDGAKEFFESLRSILPEKTSFLVVPGNHDVDRSEVDPQDAFFIIACPETTANACLPLTKVNFDCPFPTFLISRTHYSFAGGGSFKKPIFLSGLLSVFSR